MCTSFIFGVDFRDEDTDSHSHRTKYTHVKRLANSSAFEQKNEETFVIKNAQTAQSFGVR